MLWNSFCGPSFTERSIIAASERCANWFPSLIARPQGKAQYTLYRSPGLGLFTDPGIVESCRGAFWQNGRCFFVIGTSLVEVFTGGTSSVLGSVADDGLLTHIDANITQLMIVSAGHGYILTFATNAFAEIGGDFPIGDAVGCAEQDGYFLVGIKNTNRFCISAINDGLSWDAADSSTAEAKPDYIRAIISIRQQVWIFKEKSTQPFTDTGDEFPFTPNQGELIEYGIVAPDSLAKVDNALFCVAGDANGIGIVARSIGYRLQRVSNTPLENAMSTYPTIADAEGQGLSLAGRSTYRLTFPSANSGRGATWEFDVDTGQWVEIPYWNAVDGLEEAHRARVYVAAFGKILCGDRANGKIYELGMQYLDDNGAVIRRVRRSPHLVKERNQVFYQNMRFDANVGIGLDVPVGTLGYDPQMSLRWSDNGGKTWSDETGAARYISFGRSGNFDCIPQTFTLGRARNRVYEAIVTDPVDWCIAAVYFNSAAGIS